MKRVKKNCININKLLIELDADFNAKNNNRMTPLHYLCTYYGRGSATNKIDTRGLEILVLFFVENGAYIDVEHVTGETVAKILHNRGIHASVTHL